MSFWNPEAYYRGDDVWVKCAGCGQHFKAHSGAVWMELNPGDDDAERIYFCGQTCLDVAAARGTLANGLRFTRQRFLM